MLIDSGSTKFPGIIGIHGTITLKNLENNLGLIPMKLGTAKITKNCHSILYFYDVNLIITEVNDLKKKTENVATLSRKYIEHYKHSANYLNVLYFLERKVDGKLNDIFPSTYETVPSFSVRIKRGLINGLGSIFKAITGNLDASDGEKFESLISDLQNDQNKLSEAINSQNTLSVELIDNFNKTIIGAARSDFRAVSRINRDRESSFRIDEFTGKTAYGLKTLVSGISSGTGLSKTPCAATTYEVRDLDHTSPKSASGTFWRRTRSPNQDRPLIVKQPSKDKERNVMHLIILVLAISFKPEHNSTAQQQPKPNWIAEELFNTEIESNNTYEVPGNESFVCDQTVAEPQNSDTYFTDQYCEYYTQDIPENDHVDPPQNFQKDSFIEHKT
ncbi:unnamed protein product [Acanthoscelides obtectus]|uniref:Uncharacterized protein n=1 Tax=Acanthoscelides obtectus TaxID=200917 RepID=A0A9P0K1Y8_ACAOB|nr:unnamed protein product [Acanthoscelides obtectus]CAK1632074.1 hypothetical protein AOBTE_LOCUS7348 [Acanthoscelides obtectus]